MAEKGDEAHFTTQEKEGEQVTFKVKFAQFKKTCKQGDEKACGSFLKWLTLVISIMLLVINQIFILHSTVMCYRGCRCYVL